MSTVPVVSMGDEKGRTESEAKGAASETEAEFALVLVRARLRIWSGRVDREYGMSSPSPDG